MKDKVIQGLKDALAAMNDTGAHWTQGTLRDTDESDDTPAGGEARPRYCSLGAVFYVSGRDLDAMMSEQHSPDEWEKILDSGDRALTVALVKAVAEAIPDGENGYDITSYVGQECAITSWNDRSWRTWDEVVAVFERAQEQVAAREEE